MAQGRSTEIISMIKWIRTRRLSIKNSLSLRVTHCIECATSGGWAQEVPFDDGVLGGTERSARQEAENVFPLTIDLSGTTGERDPRDGPRDARLPCMPPLLHGVRL